MNDTKPLSRFALFALLHDTTKNLSQKADEVWTSVSGLQDQLFAARGNRRAADAECAATMEDMRRLRSALERVRTTVAINRGQSAEVLAAGVLAHVDAALHPKDTPVITGSPLGPAVRDNSSPAAAPPPPDPTCPQCGGPEHDRQGRPLNPAPAASPEKGTGAADCVKCIACHECVGACDCTGGPQTEPECTCYELTGGHQPGCYFNRRPLAPLNPPCTTCAGTTWVTNWNAAGPGIPLKPCPTCRPTPEAP